jgi:hypothetical protein
LIPTKDSVEACNGCGEKSVVPTTALLVLLIHIDKKITVLYDSPYLFVIFLALGMEKLLQKMG